MDGQEVLMGPSLCMEDLMELKCSPMIGDSIHLIPFETTFPEEPRSGDEEEVGLVGLRKMRRSLVGSSLQTRDGRFGCPHCEKTFSQKYIVPRHIKTMHLDHYTKCAECGEQVKNMRQHMKHKHRGSQQVKCIICNNWLSSKKELREHQETTHGPITLPSARPTRKTCPVCGIVLNNKKSLWLGHFYFQHMVSARYYQCPLPGCAKTVSKLEDDHCLNFHLWSHHSLKVDRIHHCHLCPQKCLSPDDLRGHLAVEHAGQEVAPCPLCPLAFPRHQLLALHLYLHHGKVLRGNKERPNANLLSDTDTQPATTNYQLRSTTTKYTFVKSGDMKPTIESNFEATEAEGTHDSDIEDGPFLSTENVLEIDNNIILEKVSPPLLHQPTIDLPEGTTLIKATEDEILLEVDDSNQIDTPDPMDVMTESKALELEINSDHTEAVAATKESQHFVIYLGENLVEVEVEEEDHRNVTKVPKIRRRNVEAKKRHPCTWKGCHKTFVAKHSVTIHVRNVHQSESVECNKCGKNYSNEENLKVHTRSVHSAVSTPCKWPGCHRVLSSERQMQSHYLKHSEPPRRCPYQDCYSVLKNSSVLRMHMKKMHNRRSSSFSQDPRPSEAALAPPTITHYRFNKQQESS